MTDAAPARRLAPMEAAHLPQVVEVESRAYEFPWSEQLLAECLTHGYASWVMLEGERVLGYAIFSMAAGECQILNLCVDPPYRRQGIARKLLDHTLRVARAARLNPVLLEVRRSNEAAQRLYHAAGFRQIGLRKKYYPARDGREDAFVLSLELTYEPGEGDA